MLSSRSASLFVAFISLFCLLIRLSQALPIVLWHGLGDSCCDPLGSTGRLKVFLENNTDELILSVRLGDTPDDEVVNSLFQNVDEQIDSVCAIIKRDKRLRNGFHAVGLSQGGLLFRALIERCDDMPPVHTFVSVGSPQYGVSAAPFCGYSQSNLCAFLNRFIENVAYNQNSPMNLTVGRYWHSMISEHSYLNTHNFLTDINNENEIKKNYIENLQKLKRMIFIKFDRDLIVYPRSSSWFGWIDPYTRSEYDLRETRLYQEDRLGLKRMDHENKLLFYSIDAGHLGFSFQWFLESIVKPFMLD